MPTVKANEGKLFQAFSNLLNNAEQAISNDGVIEIKTELVENLIVIKIADTGEGIKREHLSRVTDPFFTTREPGKGTGLGLSITYKILDEINGKMEFISEIGKGTTVIIKIPITYEFK